MVRTNIILLMLLYLFSWCLLASDLSDIQIENNNEQATVTLNFNSYPTYKFFTLRNPDRIVLDIRQYGIIYGLPLNFSNDNIVKCIRTSQPKDEKNIRIVFELARSAKIRTITQRNNTIYKVVFLISKKQNSTIPISSNTSMNRRLQSTMPIHNPLSNNKVSSTFTDNSRIVSKSSYNIGLNHTVIVAIDAGHGGQDPGAIGINGLKEKNVTIAIARKLKMMLDNDIMFKGVLTRDNDYFISVMGRSEVARKQNANFLVSIHADAAPNRNARGASVWVLSTHRANSEMANWLEQHEKRSELLGGAGDLLAKRHIDPYLSQAVLDLQFGYSQRVGYDVAVKVIQYLKQVSALHKRHPEHASLGVLRSPDIPSLLVEIGFISNPFEEQFLGSSAYQEKIARSIYRGLRSYFLMHPLQTAPNQKK